MPNLDLSQISTVSEVEDGVDVLMQGDVTREKVDAMVDKCSTGAQSCCGPEFFDKVTDLSVTGQDREVTVHVKGEVTTEMLQQNLAACDCYEG